MDDERIARFERLYREHFEFVWASARAMGTADAMVPDVVQEVFLTAYRRLDAIDPSLGPRGWLYGVTRRVVFRVRRTAARTARREAALRRVPEVREDSHGDAAVDLARLLDALDEPQREVFVMADLLGMSGPEMAERVGVPLDTVYSRLRLARGRLQRVARAEVVDAAIREGRRPPDALQQRRTWAALVLALPRGTGLLAAIGFGKLAAIAAGATTVAAVALALDPEPPKAPIAPPIVSASVEPATPSIAATPPIAQLVTAVPATAIDPPVVERREPRASEPRRDAPPDPDAELASLERARAKLDAGDPSEALRLLDAASGTQLADARGALRVQALCASGRTDEAQRAAEQLRAAHPTSLVAKAARCRGDGS